MSSWTTRWLGLATLGLVATATLAEGQVVDAERDTKVTGPRGRTIERDIKVQRGPGYIDRQVEIKRPGETLIRDTRVQTGPGGRPFPGPGGRPIGGPRPFGGPAYFGGPRFYGGPRIVENVIVQQPPAFGGFVGLPALSFFFGGGAPTPPPPVVVALPGVAGPPPVPQPPAFDAFADAVGRLKSFHGSSRRDGALTLGRLADPRAVPALNERLEHDFDKEVRVAAAVALGQIGDERGAVALEKATLYDKRHEVRDAAKVALEKIPKPGEVIQPPAGAPTAPSATRAQAPSANPGRPDVGDPDPSPNVPLEAPLEDRPPPPPVPAPPRGSS